MVLEWALFVSGSCPVYCFGISSVELHNEEFRDLYSLPNYGFVFSRCGHLPNIVLSQLYISSITVLWFFRSAYFSCMYPV
jgi:hypothetical protein